MRQGFFKDKDKNKKMLVHIQNHKSIDFKTKTYCRSGLNSFGRSMARQKEEKVKERIMEEPLRINTNTKKRNHMGGDSKKKTRGFLGERRERRVSTTRCSFLSRRLSRVR